MAIDPRELLKPWARDRRIAAPVPLAGASGKKWQRVQVGMFGLVSMILVVALADLVISQADRTEANAVPEAAPTVAASEAPAPRDPLADAGVVPQLPSEPEAQQARPSSQSPQIPQATGNVPAPTRAAPQ